MAQLDIHELKHTEEAGMARNAPLMIFLTLVALLSGPTTALILWLIGMY